MASDVLDRLRSHAPQSVPHASGRPWLFGRWPKEQWAFASAGTSLLAVAGRCSLTAQDLTVRLNGVRDLPDVETAVRGAAGSFHVLASVDGHSYLRGSAFGTRRLYWTTVDGVTVCADRARTLAWLTRAAVDTGQLAARLSTVDPLPHPLAGSAMWRQVHAVAPGRAVIVEPDGSHRTKEWWQPSAPHLPLAEGAVALRDVLREAVSLRARPGQILGADLSGGMDSTSLCFLAAEAGARLVTASLHSATPGNEDRYYAPYAAERLPGSESLVFPFAELPGYFAGLGVRHDPADEPTAVTRGRAVQKHLAQALRHRGARLRLNGYGGDDVLLPPRSYLHTLVRRHPSLALRHAAGWRARSRWPLPATARMLFDGRSYHRWLTAAGGRLREPAAGRPGPDSWGMGPRLPLWATDSAVHLVAGLLDTAAAQEARPLASGRGLHGRLHQAREAGRIASIFSHDSTVDALPAESPFCDDTVIAACLAVRAQDTTSPWTYKPLLAAAMDGIVPDHLLQRTTKDHVTQEWHHSLRRHRRDLAALATDSHLVAAGIADENGLRRVLHSPELLTGHTHGLEQLLAAELWLRDLAAHPLPAYLTTPESEERPVEPTTR
ncbi:asparagine synthase-related protein [Streptomyces fulvorobeus]|uniref:asparagine synthase (glutamine-hydrolyzing) n=1 Tax=Streptomyces fulvorobeus TaxID=284028 RepID=A0A7Y9H8K4_9ACTN|nr:asparagine synthase-related protein [Streptomyces fulvorobeus]NYE39857.1 asparagine synthase (glutamine-hydrolyzing) [Streptomyces fulvorobeus]